MSTEVAKSWRAREAAKRKAREFFEATTRADRFAYWSDECSFFDLFADRVGRMPDASVRREFCEMVNEWIASEDHEAA